MKKFLLSILFLIPLSGFAQKGMQGVGVNFGFGCRLPWSDYASSYGFKYQKNVTEKFRIATSLECLDHNHTQLISGFYEDYYATSYLLIVEGHYFFNDIMRFRPYAVGGVIAGFIEALHSEGYDSLSEFTGGVKLGVGLNYRIGYHLTAQLEFPVHIIYPEPFLIPSLGLVYTF